MRIAKLVAAILLFAAAALSEETHLSKLPDFSAIEVRPGDRHEMAWKIYHSGNKLRLDMSTSGAAIFDTEADKAYHLMIFPEKTVCVEMPLQKSQVMRSPLQMVFRGKMEITPAGKETMDGHTYTVEKIVTTTAKGETINSKIWLADDLRGVPAKVELHMGERTFTTTYRDIKPGTPDPALLKPQVKCIPEDKMYQVAAPGDASPPEKKDP
jgi:hypothetical protein